MISSLLTPQRLKFRLLAEGVSMTAAARARVDELRGRRKLTPADYASTSGVILKLENDVWVNAPFAEHNPNFVREPRNVLDVAPDGFLVRSDGWESAASLWLPPDYHDQDLSSGRPINHFAVTHGDRVRLSPIRGCTMRCRFCNIPYEDTYETKPIEGMTEALDRAFADPLQPARHLLVSGGTPAPGDVPFLQAVYERVLLDYADRQVDIMMVPVDGLFDLPRLKQLGLHELSINVELFNPRIAQFLMPQKHRQGMSRYVEFIGQAADMLGPRRVRSMIMVGLEPLWDTLAAVRAVAEAGGVPVLSPFRPDPSTPLRDVRPLSAEELEEVYVRASDVAADAGQTLGPDCAPCTHNTLTFASAVRTPIHVDHAPALV